VAKVRPLDLIAATISTAVRLGPWDADEQVGIRRVSLTTVRRVDGVDVETEYLWEMADSDRG
jgi:hypothetical protein